MQGTLLTQSQKQARHAPLCKGDSSRAERRQWVILRFQDASASLQRGCRDNHLMLLTLLSTILRQGN